MKNMNAIIKSKAAENQEETAIIENESMRQRLKRKGRERGVSSVEYVVLLMLVVVVGIVVYQKFGKAFAQKVQSATNSVNRL
jgi:hypothetical protein